MRHPASIRQLASLHFLVGKADQVVVDPTVQRSYAVENVGAASLPCMVPEMSGRILSR
jgi:hypothetical protein